MQPSLDKLNAWRLAHGRLWAVLGLVGMALVHAAAGEWSHALAALLAAFGLHHVHGLPDVEPPQDAPPSLPFRAA